MCGSSIKVFHADTHSIPSTVGINLPLTAMAMVSVLCFLNVKTPRDSFSAKMKRLDWLEHLTSL